MTEVGQLPEKKEMPGTRNYSALCLFIIPLVFSLSCLVASGFVVVDRSVPEKVPDMVYSDFPSKDFISMKEELPCADLDDYETFVIPKAGEERHNLNTPKLEENEGSSDVDSEIGENKEQAKTKKNEDVVDDAEDYDFQGELDESSITGDQFNDEDSSLQEKPIKRGHNSIHIPSKLHNGNKRHHKMKVKLKKFDTPREEVRKLEKEIERIAEGDETSRKIIHRKRNEPEHRKQKKLKSSVDHESELTESQEMGNLKSGIQSRDDEFAERDPTLRENMHRKRGEPRPRTKQEPHISDFGDGGSDVSSPYLQSRHRKKRYRVLGQRHLSADDEPFPTLSKRDAPIDVDDWGYCGDAGPEKWQEKWPDCGGNAQSPINLDTSVAKIDYEPILKWKGYSNTPSKMTLINNGHSVVLTTSYEDCGSRPFIWDSIMNHEYVFGELTFHWGADESSGSEHTINYMKYPLEMQVIHYRRELGSIEKAQEVPGGVAIVGILFHIDTGKHQNQGIADIQTGFGKVHDGPSSTSIQPFPLSRLIPQFSKHYLSYNGSMTTPPCTETVVWIMHLKQASISKKQLTKFHRLKNEGVEIKQNNRPIQKSNKRCVLEIT